MFFTSSFVRDENQNTPLKFTYTAMHGVGYQFIVEALKQFNFKPCIPVVEQVTLLFVFLE